MSSLYQHYKSGLYHYMNLAKLEATGELMVVYQSIETNEIYARPFNEWAVKFKQLQPVDIDRDMPTQNINDFLTQPPTEEA